MNCMEMVQSITVPGNELAGKRVIIIIHYRRNMKRLTQSGPQMDMAIKFYNLLGARTDRSYRWNWHLWYHLPIIKSVFIPCPPSY